MQPDTGYLCKMDVNWQLVTIKSKAARLIGMMENLLNIWEFVYFVCGLSPPKRRVVRRRNLASRRVPTTCRTCAGFYVYRVRRYENNALFPKMRADRPRLLLQWVTSGNGSVGWTVRSSTVGLYHPAGWLAAAARWAAKSSCSGPTGRNSVCFIFPDLLHLGVNVSVI